MFSYARNSCSRNHRRYTLCGYSVQGDNYLCDRCSAGRMREGR
jgi:hypothetical protein